MIRISEERCSCGGVMVYGHMYGSKFVAGDVGLDSIFRGKECLLIKEIFPDGFPVQGEEVLLCSKCFRQAL